MSMVENILIIISILILVSSLIGLAVMLLSSMRERRREIAILRVIGASPRVLFSLIMTELLLCVVVLACAGLITLFPAIDAYRTALHSSLSSTM